MDNYERKYNDEELRELGLLMATLPRGVTVNHTNLLGWTMDVHHDNEWWAAGGYEFDLLGTLQEFHARLITGRIKVG